MALALAQAARAVIITTPVVAHLVPPLHHAVLTHQVLRQLQYDSEHSVRPARELPFLFAVRLGDHVGEFLLRHWWLADVSDPEAEVTAVI